jgi:hypothetical protein
MPSFTDEEIAEVWVKKRKENGLLFDS